MELLELFLDFQDVLIYPTHSHISSRKDVDLSVDMGNGWKPIPIMSANMDTITGTEMAFELLKKNWIPVLHKYVSIDEISNLFDKIDEYNKNNPEKKIDYRNLFISRGATESDKEKLKERIKGEPRIKSVCIDVANGYADSVIEYVKSIRTGLCKDKILMVGNIATGPGAELYANIGVDIVKGGIGQGCFVENTKVLTSKGEKNINEIDKGDMVLTHNNRYKKVLGTATYKEKDRVISINGIKSTPSHKYYVINDKDKDKVNEENILEYAFWVEAKNLDKKNHLLVKYDNKQILKFEKIIEKEEIDFLGNVYDIEVEEDHSFTVNNGIVVHNSACLTRVQTGVGVPQIGMNMEIERDLTLFNKRLKQKIETRECETFLDKTYFCSDGGCKVMGDISKAFVSGADFVMIGGMLSGTKETPGTLETIGDKTVKRFSGMAAKESQQSGVPEYGVEEGKTVFIPYKGKVVHIIEDIEGGIRSAATYINSKNPHEFKINGKFIRTHIQENTVFNKM